MGDANVSAVDFLRRIMLEDELNRNANNAAGVAENELAGGIHDQQQPTQEDLGEEDAPLPLSIEPCSLKYMSNHIDLLESELEEEIRLRRAEIEMAKTRLAYLEKQKTLKRKSTSAAAKPRKRKLCIMEGCTSVAKWQGVCQKHGASVRVPRCSHEGCNNQAQKGGVCVSEFHTKL